MIILPSLEIVPAKFNGNILLSQIPVNGTGDFTVSRALNTATRVNSLGNIELVNADTPRIDYLTSSGTVGCPALLVEPSGTNICLQSEGFNVSATWTSLSGGTGVVPVVTQATGIVDPAGGTTAERIQLSVGSGTLSTDFSILRQTLTFTAVAHTFSVYLRSATSGSQFVAIRFNSSPQTIIEITPSWQRFTFTGTPSAGSRDFGFDLRGNNASASGSADFYAWGAQVETGSVATSYIPTTTAAVTRNADVISVSGAVSGSIGQTEGTLYIEFVQNNNVSLNRIIAIDNGTNSDNGFDIVTTAAGNIRITYRVLGVAQCDITTSVVTAVGVAYKVAFAYSQNDFVIYVNGIERGTDSSGNTTLTPSRIILGGRSDATGNVRARAAALYNTRLTNTQLALLTSPYTSYSSMASALSYTLG